MKLKRVKLKLKHLKRKHRTGFTIIEVLIVLAIAGSIMIVVFLAIPALQRNARNYERRRIAQLMYAAVREFQATGTPLPFCSDPKPSGASCPQAPGLAKAYMKNMPPGLDRVTGIPFDFTTTSDQTDAICHGEKTDSGAVTYCWDDTIANYTAHVFVAEPDYYYIISNHECTPNGKAIRDAVVTGGMNAPDFVVVVTGLENNTFYCTPAF